MKASELRNMSLAELNDKFKELMRDFFKLKMQHGNGQLTAVHKLKQTRRAIARMKTIMGEERKDANE